jgi:hypothetical protein
MKFSPQLLPNNTAGVSPDWEALLQPVSDYYSSDKADGGRVECTELGVALGRSLKVIPSINIQAMTKDLALLLQHQGYIEAELYSPNMNFAEIMHFFRSEDVTSEKSRKKHEAEWKKTKGGTTHYMKNVGGVSVEQHWEYPGRDVDWLCTWQPCLKLYVFDHIAGAADTRTKEERYADLVHMWNNERIAENLEDLTVLLKQTSYNSIDELYQAYDQAIISGYEGLVVIHKNAPYKMGRHSLNSGMAYKIKEDNLQFDGVILSLEEGTEVIEGIDKKINELGRSVTSKLKEHRTPSGLCKGFKVRMDDGNELTVSLKDYPHPDRRAMLLDPSPYIGQTIRFTGMAAVKEGGCPRHAHYTKGNIRDAK